MLNAQKKKYLYVGWLMAMGIVQGSSSTPFLSPPVFDYLCGREVLLITVSLQDVPLLEVLQLLDKVNDYKAFSASTSIVI